MKGIKLILTFIILLTPAVVFASGDSDDNTDELGVSHLNINCVYEQLSSVPGMPNAGMTGIGTYINLEFEGISDTGVCGGGTAFTYSFGNLSSDGKFEKNYEYLFSSGTKTGGRWLNYDKKYGSEYWLQAWWCNQFFKGDSMDKLSGSEIQKKADNGGLCPDYILVTQKKENSAYYFVSCRDLNDCYLSEYQLSKDNIYKNVKYYKFTGTSVAISNINQDSLDETNAEEKVEEAKQNIEDYCDETSPNYDEAKCTESKIVSNATEETASDIVTYNPNSKVELDPIEYGKVTCATIFKKSNGNYNDTHKLLSTTLRFIQYLGVTLALILSVVDYIKVVPTQDKDALMKATKNAALRLGIAIVIFFVPIILDFILGLIGFNDPTCGLL